MRIGSRDARSEQLQKNRPLSTTQQATGQEQHDALHLAGRPVDGDVLKPAVRQSLGAAVRSDAEQQEQPPSVHFANTPRTPPAINAVTSATDSNVATPGGAAR